MNKFRKVMALVCALVMAAAIGAVSVFAADPVSNAAKDYDHVIHINIDRDGNLTKRAEESTTASTTVAPTVPTSSESTTAETTEVPTTQPVPTTVAPKKSTPKRSIANTGDTGLAAAASVAAVAAAAFVISKRK